MAKATEAAIRAQKKYKNGPRHKRVYKDWFESIHGRAIIAYSTSKRRAKLSSKEYSLTLEWFEEKIAIGTCEVSAIPFDLTKHNKGCPQFYSPSVDRIDNTKGYTMENCQLVLDGYNRGKGTATDKDMLILAKALMETQV